MLRINPSVMVSVTAHLLRVNGYRSRSRSVTSRVVREADPADKADIADIYAQLKLTLTYRPDRRLVEATMKPGLNMRKGQVVSEDRVHPKTHASWPRSLHLTVLADDGGRPGHQVVHRGVWHA
jgi:hypothetical protein